MSDGEVLTIHLTTDELKKLIRDEIGDVIADRPTKQDVQAMVKSEVGTVLTPVMQLLEKIRTDLEGSFDKRFNNTDRQLALLVQSVDSMKEAVGDVKKDLDDLDAKVDKTQERMNRFESAITEHTQKIESQEHAIFGDPARPGTKSIVDHISELGENLTSQMGQEFRKVIDKIEAGSMERRQIRQDLDIIKPIVEENTRFRQRRQHIEQAIIQAVPQTIKKAMGGVAWDWVKSKAIPATLGATLFSLLIEWLKAVGS